FIGVILGMASFVKVPAAWLACQKTFSDTNGEECLPAPTACPTPRFLRPGVFSMRFRPAPVLLLMTLSWCASAPSAAEPPPAPFEKQIAPFLAKHCVHCHGPTKQNGGIAFDHFQDAASVLKDRKTWQKVLHVLQARAMPPKKRPQPAQDEVDAVTAWIRD